MTTELRLLLVAEGSGDVAGLTDGLRVEGSEVHMQRVDPDAAVPMLAGAVPDVVLVACSALDGKVTRSHLQEAAGDVPVVVVCGEDDEVCAAALVAEGADDYVVAGNPVRMASSIRRALRLLQERRAHRSAEAALRKSEESYRQLVENANDVVFTVDLEGNFTSLNTAGEQISGYRRDEVVQMNMAQVLTPASLARAFQMIHQKLQEGRPTTYDIEMIAQDGHLVPLELSTRLIVHDGRPVGVQGIARDITERQKAAQALRESEQRYRALFQNASDLVYTHDLRGRFTSLNRATEELTGYTLETHPNLNISDVVAPEHLEQARDMIRYKLAGGAPTAYEIDILTHDGRCINLEVNTQLIYQEGKPIGVQGIGRDITARRKAEAELRARERKQAVVARLGQEALATTDLDGLFDQAVLRVTETLGVEYCNVLELLPEEEVLLSRAGAGWQEGLVGRATVGLGPQSFAGYTLLSSEPVVMENLAGEERFSVPPILANHGVTSGMSVIVGGQDHPFGVLTAFSREQRVFTQDDVHFLTAVANVLASAVGRRRMEEEREAHNRELATRVIQAQEEERKRIARELHDETAQSLSMLLTNLDLLDAHLPPDNEALRSGMARVGALARRTLDETRAISHDLRPTILDDVGLVAALQWLGAEYEHTFGGSVHVDAEFTLSLPPEVEVALFRIAQEALTNSCKHAGASEVRVRLYDDDGSLHLVVQDDGRGFDPDRVPRPTRAGRLGLYGMHERAALLGGTLTISTKPRRGTRVEVTVPVEGAEREKSVHARAIS